MIGRRLMLIGLGAALGLALLSQGFVVIGALVLTMSVVRAVLVLRWRHRVEARARRVHAVRGTVDARRAGSGATTAARRPSSPATSDR